jgi:predicted nucleic acid-binding protein
MIPVPARHLYWDTCVFIAYLNDERLQYGRFVDHITQYLDDSRRVGSCKIYTSTLTIAEIPRSRLKPGAFPTFRQFLNDYRDAITQIAPDPNIMELASDLHGITYTKSGGSRKLATPDAVHLASALILQSVYGVTLDAFHTFDNGSQRGIGGRAVPLLSYETWCEQCLNEPVVQEVIRLRREPPEHPAPRLALIT